MAIEFSGEEYFLLGSVGQTEESSDMTSVITREGEKSRFPPEEHEIELFDVDGGEA